MKGFYLYAKIFIVTLTLVVFSVNSLTAQDGPPQFVQDAVNAVEKMLNSEGKLPLEQFIDSNMVRDKTGNREALINRLVSIREATKGLRDDISVEAEPDGISLYLSAKGEIKRIKIALDPNGISDINLAKTPDPIVLTKDNLQETFDRFESDGMSGVVYIRRDGKVLIKHAFGMANKDLGIPNSVNTVFGTGSRPIDYTVAGIYLLNQNNKLDLGDTIDKYFEDVPADKKSITIRYLLTGQSGLPDFFHTEKDWDPDLAWVDRETAEKRILSQQLLFTPGTDRQHSHGAFVLLAALIERVSGMHYYPFIRQNFLDPAGMEHTGEYGEKRQLSINDFAAGNGPQFVGLPNIPPNWGPTSWLIKGSGGMYSNLGDLLKFYDFVRSGKVLDEAHNKVFVQPAVNLDGSDRGFELFSIYSSPQNIVFLFINSSGDREKMKLLFRALEKFAESGQ